MRWQTRGACRDTDPELFFPPDDGQGLADTEGVQVQVAAARQVCRFCPVQRECLAWALDSGQDHGIWAATTPGERRVMRYLRAHGVPDPVADAEPMCPACSLLFPMPAVDGSLCPACTERGAA
ncbi:WhiB family transcriptional regulator [Actinomycetospora chibensis]|uniref:Transcriptional regulator WhiB n=1 Tax=Actinomycetospora chibensis TaxID=663606 RepID=A0ABV9RPW5_9PSEU|nr:WhiB family transcriptional regulator [Actinomycetospora chibensis]MDD7926945.1 WhiB family transcriptional regulator [Actinomycetospora chibensis]